MTELPNIWSERWHLAALNKEELIKLGLVALMIGMGCVLYHLQGNTTDIRMFGRSAVAWMVFRWGDLGGDFSHGWLIPFVSAYLVWRLRKELAAAPKKAGSKWGLAFIILALLAHWIGAKGQQTRLSLFSMMAMIWAVPMYLYGWQLAKLLIFPCSYLIFCIPLNFLDSLTFPLRIMVTIIATWTLNGIGIAAERSGSAIYSLAAGGFSFDVADPCSGLRSLLAMTALTAVYAYLTQRTLTRKWILFLASIPLAIIGNLARIVTIALVAEAFGEEIATGLYHDYSGYITFSVAIGVMVALGTLINLEPKKVWSQWKSAHLSPT